jgi:hypothetical protein
MYRPEPQGPTSSVATVFFTSKNQGTLRTVLLQDFEQRHGPLNDAQTARLDKMIGHYQQQVYQRQGEKPLVALNKEVLVACAKDFTQYLQRKEATREINTVQVAAEGPTQAAAAADLFLETSQRFERLTTERQSTMRAAQPPPLPDFRISLSEDGPPAAEMYERAKKAREAEAARLQGSDMAKAQAGLQNRIAADSQFQAHQDAQQRATELALVQRNARPSQPPIHDATLVVLPDRRELMMKTEPLPTPAPIQPADLLPRHAPVIAYREVENNLIIYSADRDWLKNSKENRYHFTVTFDPAANADGFGPSLAAQQRFKNIVRIELVKAILPGESLSVTVKRTTAADSTSYQDSLLNLPFVSCRIAELEHHNYGTDSHLDDSFAVLQHDGKWTSDSSVQQAGSGFVLMVPKYMKCQREYYPTPLATLQRLTVDLRRPNGELLTPSQDAFDVAGIIAPQVASTAGTTFPFSLPITWGATSSAFNVLLPSAVGDSAANGAPANFYVVTARYFSQFDLRVGDRIVIAGYQYPEEALNDPTYGGALRAFAAWVGRPEGHVVIGAAYTPTLSTVQDGFNDVGYANMLVIPTRYEDPTTGSVLPQPFGPNFGAVLNTFGIGLASPIRLINLNKQTTLVMRIVTREMDSQPTLRSENTF